MALGQPGVVCNPSGVLKTVVGVLPSIPYLGFPQEWGFVLLFITMKEEVALSSGDKPITIKATYENNSLHGCEIFLKWT